MKRPLHDFEEENNARGEDEEELDEDELEEEWKKQGEEIPHDTAASTKPDHKWVLMRGAWIYFVDSMRERGYRSPDALAMYIYNDFEGYGLLEMVENSVSKQLVYLSYICHAVPASKIDSYPQLLGTSIRNSVREEGSEFEGYVGDDFWLHTLLPFGRDDAIGQYVFSCGGISPWYMMYQQ